MDFRKAFVVWTAGHRAILVADVRRLRHPIVFVQKYSEGTHVLDVSGGKRRQDVFGKRETTVGIVMN